MGRKYNKDIKMNNKKKGWRFKGNEILYLRKLLASDFSSGSSASMNEALESKFAKIHNQKFAITANSGTSTLHMALNAFGVGHGDEVILPSLTVALCGYSIWQCGAVPVYADVNKDTFLIDTDDLEKKITKKTKAIMPVHLYGLMCDMNKIMKLAKKYNLFVVEDCAQCFLGYDDKKRVSGSIGHVGSWSFETTKHITTGEGGIVTTNSKKFGELMRKFGSAGYKNLKAGSGKIRIDKDKFQDPNWKRHEMLSYNYRLSEVSAAIGLAQIERLKFFVDLRIKAAEGMKKIIKQYDIFNLLSPQKNPYNYINSYYTLATKFNGNKYGIKWQDFRKKFMEFGGDGIYAAWTTVNNEPPFKEARLKGLYSGSLKISNSYGWGETPVAENLQKKIMQFTTNQKDIKERKIQQTALKNTLNFFNKIIK